MKMLRLSTILGGPPMYVVTKLRAHRAIVALLITVSLLMVAASAEAQISGALGSGDLTATLTPETTRNVKTTIEPAEIERGEPMSGKMSVTDTLLGSGTLCEPPPPIDQTSTFTAAWPFHKVPAGFNFWTARDAGVLEVVHILISGTQRQTNQ